MTIIYMAYFLDTAYVLALLNPRHKPIPHMQQLGKFKKHLSR